MIRKGFTLIEIIMVIIVLGIISSIGADIIASMYENYLRTRAINRLESQTEIALEQIAKRLQYRIKDSAIARRVTPADILPLSSSSVTAQYDILEWISTSNESLQGLGAQPGWSGLIDLDSAETNSTARTIKTPGSDLNVTSEIIKALTYGELSMDGTGSTNQGPAIIFKGKRDYNISQYYPGTTSPTDYYLNVQRNANDRFVIPNDDNVTNNELYEQYYLSHTAYAIVPGTGNDFNITLHYNYQPWEGETYLNGDTSVLVEHASTFRFTQIGETIRIKLCVTDGNQSTTDFEFGACKEKVVY